MFTRLGICALLAGLFLGLFSGISTLMNADNIWVDLTFFKILGEKKTEAIILFFDNAVVQQMLDTFFYEWPLALIVICLGAVLLVVGLFVRDH